jgi:hypothetical protein
MAWVLAQQGLRFVVLDAGPELDHVWRGRWDSLKLFTPAQYDALPGMPFPAPATDLTSRNPVACRGLARGLHGVGCPGRDNPPRKSPSQRPSALGSSRPPHETPNDDTITPDAPTRCRRRTRRSCRRLAPDVRRQPPGSCALSAGRWSPWLYLAVVVASAGRMAADRVPLSS